MTDGLSVGVHLFDHGSQQFSPGFSSLANAAATRTVEIIPIDQAAQRRGSARLIFVNVIEGQPGIETGAPAEGDAFAQAPACFHPGADEGKLRTAAQLQPLMFFPGVAGLIRLEQ